MQPPKLVVLDRDGTINEDRVDYVRSAEEWVPIPGALEAIARLNHAGWHVVIATNQSGLGRGLFDMANLNAMHAKMSTLLAQVGGRIDAVFFCPHAPDESCECRKPLPGLYLEIADRYNVHLQRGGRRSATRCATCRRHRPPAANRTWCAPARPRSSATRRSSIGSLKCRARACIPTSAAFVDFLMQREGVNGERFGAAAAGRHTG